MASDTRTLDRPVASDKRPAGGIGTILVHIQNDSGLDRRLEVALSLARPFGAHLSCVHVTPVEAYVAFDGFGGVFVMNDILKVLDEEELKLRTRVEAKLRSEDVSWDYQQVTGNVASQIARNGALADLIVVGREPHESKVPRSRTALFGELLDRSRTPLFIPAEDQTGVGPTDTAMIAWDGSYEAANAVRSSIGLLQASVNVRVLQIGEEGKEDGFPSTKLLEYLSRHGIHAELSLEPPGSAKGADIAGLLLAYARSWSAAYIVMGAYNHSRVGEYLFGGVTRALLRESAVPLVIAR